MNVVEIINEAIASGRTRFAFELLPPLKGDGMQKIFAAVEPLMALDPAYVNITFHREGIKETEREDGSVEWHVVRRRPGTVGISAVSPLSNCKIPTTDFSVVVFPAPLWPMKP